MQRRIILLFVAIVGTLSSARVRAELPTTRPFTLEPRPLYNNQQQDLDRLLEAYRKPDPLLAPKPLPQFSPDMREFYLNLKPLPSNVKPRGPVEQWSGSTRPALMHITPNVVEVTPGGYMTHQDNPRIVLKNAAPSPYREDKIDTDIRLRRQRSLDLIDDRPKQK